MAPGCFPRWAPEQRATVTSGETQWDRYEVRLDAIRGVGFEPTSGVNRKRFQEGRTRSLQTVANATYYAE